MVIFNTNGPGSVYSIEGCLGSVVVHIHRPTWPFPKVKWGAAAAVRLKLQFYFYSHDRAIRLCDLSRYVVGR